LAEPFNVHADWRYTLLTGLLPAIPIALLLPFVPESKVWRERRAAGTLRRPSFGELFSARPATDYFGHGRIVCLRLRRCLRRAAIDSDSDRAGLATLAEEQKILRPLQEEAGQLNRQLNEAMPRFQQACDDVAGLRQLAGRRAKVRVGMRASRGALDGENVAARRDSIQSTLNSLTNQWVSLDTELTQLTAAKPQARQALLEREKLMGQLGANREKQSKPDTVVKTRGKDVQWWQEMGGLLGRITLAALLALALAKRTLLRLFQVPGLVVVPLTYLWLFREQPEVFQWGVFAVGFLTVAQFSYFGEYLPKVFPVHLRGTGGSFATNVGGRMLGTSAAVLTGNWVAPLLGGMGPREWPRPPPLLGRRCSFSA
jgi:hypothetical protein